VALTPKQEGFAQDFVKEGNASDAYRANFNCENMKQATIHRSAKELLDHPKVSARIAELRQSLSKRNAITVDDLIKELEEARIAALTAESPQSAAAVGATMGKAKLLGMDKQVIDLSSKDGSMTPKESVKIDAALIKSVLTKLNDEC
jgi:phage terminase small subunit